MINQKDRTIMFCCSDTRRVYVDNLGIVRRGRLVVPAAISLEISGDTVISVSVLSLTSLLDMFVVI